MHPPRLEGPTSSPEAFSHPHNQDTGQPSTPGRLCPTGARLQARPQIHLGVCSSVRGLIAPSGVDCRLDPSPPGCLLLSQPPHTVGTTPLLLTPQSRALSHPNVYAAAGTAPTGAALAATPTFTPGPTAATGLDLLAAAVAATTTPGGQAPLTLAIPGPHPLAQRGPYNPAAVIPAKVARKILELEFMEMSEVTLDNDIPQTPGCPPAPARLPITDISR